MRSQMAPRMKPVTADVMLVNGRVLTMAGDAVAAVAVRGDRVLAVGGERELAALRGPRTAIVDLGGRLALPGFTDSHVHLRALGGMLSRVNLERARTLAAALRQVAARARRVPAGQWITGGGFDKNRWGDEFPDRRDLDQAAPHHPVLLHSRDGHSVWVNSAALRICGIGRDTTAPAGGVILRDAAGEPTGVLQEKAAALVYSCRAFDDRGGGRDELLAGLRALVRQGVTSVHAMAETETLGDLQALREKGQLPLRVTLYRPAATLDALIGAGVRSGIGDEWLRIGGVKLLVDGTLGSQTAWLFQPYEIGSAYGVPVLYGGDLRDLVRRASEAGLACAVHAIGDRANAEALEALEQATGQEGMPRPALPHRIEHAQLVRPQDLPRFARLGVVASMQPCHILGDIDSAERYWGPRSRWAYPIRSLMKAGASVVFGSDAPVETADPMWGIYAAVRRQTRDGRPAKGWYRREEGVSTMAALRAYTVAPAKATGEGAFKGKLAPGYLADIVVLSEDLSRVRPSRLMKPRVDMVLVGGRVRYRRAR